MAFDKLVDSAKLDEEMKATADAIRLKTGGKEPIPWETAHGFSGAVEEVYMAGYQGGVSNTNALRDEKDAEHLADINSVLANHDGAPAADLDDADEAVRYTIGAACMKAQTLGYTQGVNITNAERNGLDESRLAEINVALTENGGTAADTLDNVDEKIPEVRAAGVKSEYDRFWDAFQQNGNRSDYRYSFAGYGWTDENFRPKYPVSPTGACGQMFCVNPIKDMKLHMETYKIVVDTSRSSNVEQIFMNSSIETYGILDASACNNLNYVLYGAKQLRSIDKIILKNDGSQTGSYFAQNAGNLVDIAFEGVIGQNGWSFQWNTKLSRASIESIIAALSATASGKSITLSKTAVNAAFKTDEWNALAGTKTNWTISLV